MEEELTECGRFEDLYVIGKILGETVLLETIASKTKSDWVLTSDVRYVDLGNGSILIKFPKRTVPCIR